MKKSKTLGDLIFGENNSDQIIKLWFSHDITKKQANQILERIKNPEMVYILDCLRTQINRKDKNVKYSTLENQEKFDYFSLQNELFLFTNRSYIHGFIQKFYRLLDKAFPEYRTLESQPIGEILMTRR